MSGSFPRRISASLSADSCHSMVEGARFHEIQGDGGHYLILIKAFTVMVELQYGDYLAYTCTALKGEGSSDMIWKIVGKR